MKKVYAGIFLSIITISCSPKIGTKITAKQDPLLFSDFVFVSDLDENYPITGIEIGTIKSGDNGLSTDCDYKSVIENLKVICRQNGANVMKIIQHWPPDQMSSCDRVKAKIYKVEDYKIYQKKIEWSNMRKLTWQDFKSTPQGNNDMNIAAQISCGFSLQNNEKPMFGDENLYVKNTFKCKSSWVRQGMNTAEVLAHEQGNFDLSEVYARLLRKKLTEENLIVFHKVDQSTMIFNDFFSKYLERRDLYETQTDHGRNADEQARWSIDIANELRDLGQYYESD